MIAEILFSEVCNFFGEPQNGNYLKASCPEDTFIDTALNDKPYFVDHDVELLMMGASNERFQRVILEKLRPYRERLKELCDKGTVMLFTGNAGDIFCRKIDYVTEKLSVEGLGFFDLDVRTDWFRRINGKTIGEAEGVVITAFQSRFSEYQGDNSSCAFLKVERGMGAHAGSAYEGLRKNNLICTQLLGPILPDNPDFCNKLISLAHGKGSAAFYEDAAEAYRIRLAEFRDPSFHI